MRAWTDMVANDCLCSSHWFIKMNRADGTYSVQWDLPFFHKCQKSLKHPGLPPGWPRPHRIPLSPSPKLSFQLQYHEWPPGPEPSIQFCCIEVINETFMAALHLLLPSEEDLIKRNKLLRTSIFTLTEDWKNKQTFESDKLWFLIKLNDWIY